jgi:hypothetical protein
MNKRQTGMMDGVKMGFGIFMVLFYLGLAVMLARNIFGMPKYLSWFFAVAFGAYGIYRGYRELKGEHTYGMRRYDDEAEEKEYEFGSYAERLKNQEGEHDDENK